MGIGSIAKSIIGSLAAGATAAVTAVADGSLSTGDTVTIVLAMLATFGIVWAVPNKSA